MLEEFTNGSFIFFFFLFQFYLFNQRRIEKLPFGQKEGAFHLQCPQTQIALEGSHSLKGYPACLRPGQGHYQTLQQ